MKPNYDDVRIPVSAMRKWPNSATFIGVYDDVVDMFNDQHRAVKLLWLESPGRHKRLGLFDIETGDYLGDTIG